MKLICPRCRIATAVRRYPQGPHWVCDRCGGQAVTVPTLRRRADQKLIRAFWTTARARPAGPGHDCPSCGRTMRDAVLETDGEPIHLDTCRTCQLVWFDRQELEQSPGLAPRRPEPEIEDPAARKALQDATIQMVKAAMRRFRQEQARARTPQKLIFGVLGLPIEENDLQLDGRPWLTWSLALALLVISGLALEQLEDAVAAFGFYPNDVGRKLGMTMLTACFLHAGGYHLLGNLYFLWVFGDNVEIALGRVRFALLLVGGAVLGCLAHAAFDPQKSIPVIGASSAISGVMVCYAFAFPRARIGVVGPWYRHVSMPAIGYIACWVGLQFAGAYQQVHGMTSVSAFGHLGGALAGLLTWFYWSGRWGKMLADPPA